MRDLGVLVALIAFWGGLLGFAIYGWVINLLALINMEPFVFTAKSIIGIGGIFVPPVGVIMGLFVW